MGRKRQTNRNYDIVILEILFLFFKFDKAKTLNNQAKQDN